MNRPGGIFSSAIKSTGWSGWALIAIVLFSIAYSVSSRQEKEDWQGIQGSDGTGYYAYLPATYIYKDFSFHFIDSLSSKYPNLAEAGNCGFCNLFDGKGVNKYFAGESVLLTPFFLAAHLASGSKEHPADGYSYFYMLAIMLGSIFYLGLGLYCSRSLLKRFKIPDGIIAITLLAVFSGTNLFYYAIWSPAMSHIYSFGLIACFFLCLHKQLENFTRRRLVFLAALLALIILVRPVNGLVVFALPFFAGNPGTLRSFFSQLVNHWPSFFLSLGLFLLILFIQPLYYYLQSGHWLVYAYGKEGFDFAHPNFFNCLFSYSNGFFVYAPLLLIATTGVFVFLRENLFRFAGFFFFFCMLVWVISSWWAWTYGGAFGMRPLVEYISLFALLLGLLLKSISSRKIVLVLFSILVLLPLAGLCQLQTWQFNKRILAADNMTKEDYWMVFLETREQFFYMNAEYKPASVPENAELLFTKTLDFETADPSYDRRSVISGKAFSGSHAVCLEEQNNHPPFLGIRIGNYFQDSVLEKRNLWANASAEWMLEDNGSEARLNIFVKSNGKLKIFEHQYVIHQVRRENVWGKCSLSVKLPPLKAGDSLFVSPERNVWFPVYVDDLSMRIYGER